MPPEPMRRTLAAFEAADAVLVLGSSLVVRPAADFPTEFAARGGRLAIVNREPTHIDSHAALVIRNDIGDTLSDVVAEAGLRWR